MRSNDRTWQEKGLRQTTAIGGGRGGESQNLILGEWLHIIGIGGISKGVSEDEKKRRNVVLPRGPIPIGKEARHLPPKNVIA